MLAIDPRTGEEQKDAEAVAMMLHLVRRGYAVASAEAFHLTYEPAPREGLSNWRSAAYALLADHPEWTGIGKLVADTKLVIDALAADPRTDDNRIGIAGHSLGGVMSFYTGCLDVRVKAILASDFGFRSWDSNNWKDPWYWGSKVEQLKAAGMENRDLLSAAAPAPMMLLAGMYENEESVKAMQGVPGYEGMEDRLVCINHATGHRPPADVLEQGYDFLDRWLK